MSDTGRPSDSPRDHPRASSPSATPSTGPHAPRLADVAALAGVSTMTASNVVRGLPGVGPRTRERVLRAIDQLGYRPNVLARRLRSGRTGIIA
ncbi:MAG TPA: LacI family DNA-binding transcriptional regulator, partial [Actinopolymorphaceae bacterium]